MTEQFSIDTPEQALKLGAPMGTYVRIPESRVELEPRERILVALIEFLAKCSIARFSLEQVHLYLEAALETEDDATLLEFDAEQRFDDFILWLSQHP